MTTLLQITTTTPTRDEADRIAAALVERRLAACVQVAGPITSVYRWEGRLETAHEWLCIIKTTAARYPQIETAIRELHSYELPEIIGTEIMAGNGAYLRWVEAETVSEE